MKAIITEEQYNRIVLKEQQLTTSPCKQLRDREIVVVYGDSPYIGPQDIVGTYIPYSLSSPGGFTPRDINTKKVEDIELKEKLENKGYLKDLVKSKDKPKWGLYVFKDELKSSTTRLSNITSSQEIKRMIESCKYPKRVSGGGKIKPWERKGWRPEDIEVPSMNEEIKKDRPTKQQYIQALKDIRPLIPTISHNIIHNKGLEHNNETIISLNKQLFQKAKEGDDTILDELWEIAGTLLMKNAINIITFYTK